MRNDRFELTDRSSKFEIAVKGYSHVLLPAERAVLSIEVSNKSLDKQSAAKDVVGVARQVEVFLRGLGPQANTDEAKAGAAIDYWSRTSLIETSSVEWDSNKQVHLPREYTAKVDFDAHFQQFQAISGLISKLSALPHNTTKPVQWILKEETKEAHQSELRIEAAKDAHRKAKDYAIALGYEKVKPCELQEMQVYAASSSRKSGRKLVDPVQSTKKNLAELEEGWEEVKGAIFDYQVEDIKVTCTVDTAFFAE